MAENSTIARPYAQAAFDLAQQKGELKVWSDMLSILATIVSDEQMKNLIGNPLVGKDALVDLVFNVCGDKLNKEGQNFVHVLADNKRLEVVPEIATLFEAHRAEAESTVEAEVISAFPLSDAQKTNLVSALKDKLGREVNLAVQTDESLIGGAIVRAGDMVIDGSVTGHLEKLAQALVR
jgi:F-type H+-transporting ATPase subunit delta